jgi:hypothetical protein
LEWLVSALSEQLQSAQEDTKEVLGLDCEYNRQEGVMRLRAKTKISAFLEKRHLTNITKREIPMSLALSKEMTRKNTPESEPTKDMLANRKTYRTCVGFFCYTTNTVFVQEHRSSFV